MLDMFDLHASGFDSQIGKTVGSEQGLYLHNQIRRGLAALPDCATGRWDFCAEFFLSRRTGRHTLGTKRLQNIFSSQRLIQLQLRHQQWNRVQEQVSIGDQR
jgi:hypothetical protein